MRKSRRKILYIRPINIQIKSVLDNKKYPNEKWLPVSGFELYYLCSNYGRILSLDRYRIDKNGRQYNKVGKLLKWEIDKDGYASKKFVVNNNKKQLKISRLVASLFVKKYNPNLDVDHIDFNKLNNYYKNLRSKSKSENTLHSAINGRLKSNASHFKNKKWRQKNTTIKYDKFGNFLEEYSSLDEAAKSVNGRKGLIWRVINKRGKTAYGYKWAYKN